MACGPASLLRALEPLAKHRHADGFEVLLSNEAPDAAIAALGRAPDFLLIVGDTARGGGDDPAWAAPTKLGSQYRWREVQPERFAADPLWADLDRDGIPDFPVGRIPARTPEMVTTVVQKTLTFEARELTSADLGLPIWGGTPALGMLFDEVATTALQTIVRKNAPAWSEPWLMFGNPRSPLSAVPESQPSFFNARLSRGGYLTAMIGHGGPRSFLSQLGSNARYGYDVGHTIGLLGDRPSPPHIILACDCGTFDGNAISLSETMLFASGGPVNVVAASTESHPLTNYYSALCSLAEMDRGHARFGELWQSAQLAAFGTEHRTSEILLKNAEGALEAEINIPKLKRDQLLMYALLGDPATAMPSISSLQVEVTAEGKGWRWTVDKPTGAGALELGIRRPASPPRSKPIDASVALATQLFEQWNAASTFAPTAPIPAEANWTGLVHGPGRLRFVTLLPDGLGVATVEVNP
jgi:hypothetical protein